MTSLAKSLKVFDIRRFREILSMEMRSGAPNRRRLERCCMVRFVLFDMTRKARRSALNSLLTTIIYCKHLSISFSCILSPWNLYSLLVLKVQFSLNL